MYDRYNNTNKAGFLGWVVLYSNLVNRNFMKIFREGRSNLNNVHYHWTNHALLRFSSTLSGTITSFEINKPS